MGRWWTWLGIGLWLAGTATAWLLGPLGVRTEPVELGLADGTRIHATYYAPQPRWAVQPAAVVIHGTAASHRSCSLGLSLPLARNGFHVLAIDLRGHGNSAGSLPAAEFGHVEELLTTLGEHPEIHAAIDYLKQRPSVDVTRIALVGHSRGGWAAANVGYQRSDIRSVVAIGIAPRTCDLQSPRNYLILAGGKDLLSSLTACTLAMRAGTGGAVQVPDTPFGDWQRGDARRWLVVTRVGHLTELADPAVSRRTIQWICSSFDLDAGPVPGHRLVLVIAALLGATIGGIVGVTGILRSAIRTQVVKIEPASHSASWLRGVAWIVLLGMAGPATAFVWDWLPGGQAFGVEAAVALLTFVGIAALLVFGRRVASLHSVGHRSGGILQQLGWGLLALGLSALAIGVPWGLTWTDLIPTSQRLALMLFLILLLSPACVVISVCLSSVASGTDAPWKRILQLGAVWLAIPILLCGGHSCIVSAWKPLLMVPVWFIAAGTLIPLPLWLVHGGRELVLPRALAHVVGAAWLLACHLPFVHE